MKPLHIPARMDPVEAPMLVGLGAMVLGISLGSMTITVAGSLIILVSAILNILFGHAPNNETNQAAMNPDHYPTLNRSGHIDEDRNRNTESHPSGAPSTTHK